METTEDRLYAYCGKRPALAGAVFLAPGSRIIGDVRLGEGVSVWFNAVVRGDINAVAVGAGSNIQDNAVLHVTSGEGGGLTIGTKVTVGHGAVVHACTVGDRVLIGMNATVLDGAVVGAGSIVAAGAVVSPGTVIPPGSLAAGVPAKVLRALGPEQEEEIAASADRYRGYAREMMASLNKT
jgi:carbonic anhydrase/acetyltransferase-like protein (isoleucine patch superfamily)